VRSVRRFHTPTPYCWSDLHPQREGSDCIDMAQPAPALRLRLCPRPTASDPKRLKLSLPALARSYLVVRMFSDAAAETTEAQILADSLCAQSNLDRSN